MPFALARALGEAWPGDVARDTLIARVFGSTFTDESHRARLRVEVGRLRTLLQTIAKVSATKRGFALAPRRGPHGFHNDPITHRSSVVDQNRTMGRPINDGTAALKSLHHIVFERRVPNQIDGLSTSMKPLLHVITSFAFLLACMAARAQEQPQPQPGSLDVRWNEGVRDCSHNTQPSLQVHRYNANTYVLRQNPCATMRRRFCTC